jgi:hypothetical protein
MLTLGDINALTNSHDGDIYSDLYKDVYGCRPRYAKFFSVEEFDEDFKFLSKKLNEQIEQDKKWQEKNRISFEIRINEIMFVTNNMNREDALRILAQAEDMEEDIKFYGWERMEYEFDLGYGYIKGTM